MTKDEALKLLVDAPYDDKLSRVNPSLTRKQVVDVVRAGLHAISKDPLDDLMIRVVWQVKKDQKRPKY